MAEMALIFHEVEALDAYMGAMSKMLSHLPPERCRRTLPEKTYRVLLWAAAALAHVTADVELRFLCYLPEYLGSYEIGHRLPYRVMRRLLRHSAGGVGKLEQVLAIMVRSAVAFEDLVPARLRYQRDRDLRMNLQSVLDWLIANYLTLDRNQLSGDWDRLTGLPSSGGQILSPGY